MKYLVTILVLCIVLLNIEATSANKRNNLIDNNVKKDPLQQNTINTKENKLEIKKNDTIKQEKKQQCVGPPALCKMTEEAYTKMIINYIYPKTYEWVLIATHTTVFIVGLVGNTLVCIAVYRNHTMRTVTNYFIVNLAVADFLVILLCLPPTVLWDVTETWFFGNAMCKIVLYLQSVSVMVSVLTLTFISLDRWYAICFPLKFKSTTGRAMKAMLIIWVVSLIFNIPELVVLTTAVTVPLRFDLPYLVQCVATWSNTADLVWSTLKLFLMYTIPLLLMSVAHCQIVRVLWRSEKIPGQAETDKLAPAEKSQLRSRKKAAKMLAAVVVMFAVCYFPVHLLSIFRYSSPIMDQTNFITIMALVSHVMCYANSAINPLIYNFMSDKFRHEFRRAFGCTTQPSRRDDIDSSARTRLTTTSRKLESSDSKRHDGYATNTALF